MSKKPAARVRGGSCASVYRYGFNGKENDNEIKGEGNQQDYGMRVYDPRIGRFLSVDPISTEYPWYSPYQFAGNKPILFIDLDGMEEAYRADFTSVASALTVVRTKEISKSTQMAVDRTGKLLIEKIEERGVSSLVSWGLRVAPMTTALVLLPQSMGNNGYISPKNSFPVAVLYKPKETLTNDPANIPDDELLGVAERIKDGTASAQDYNLQAEISRRKKAGEGLFGKAKTDGDVGLEKVNFIQGSGANAKKIEVVLPDGYKKTKLKSHGQPVYSNGKTWITPDQDGHNGGVWKMYDKEDDVGGGKDKRTGTYDENLNKIGD